MEQATISAMPLIAAISSNIEQLKNGGWRALAVTPIDETARRGYIAALAHHRGRVLGMVISSIAEKIGGISLTKPAAVRFAMKSSTVISSGGLYPTLSIELADQLQKDHDDALLERVSSETWPKKPNRASNKKGDK